MNEAFRFRQAKSRERIKSFSSLPDEVGREILARPSPESSRLDERELAVQLLDALPRAYREAIVLRHVDGLSYAEIAEVMKTTTGQVGSLLHRARQLLLERFPQRVD